MPPVLQIEQRSGAGYERKAWEQNGTVKAYVDASDIWPSSPLANQGVYSGQITDYLWSETNIFDVGAWGEVIFASFFLTNGGFSGFDVAGEEVVAGWIRT